ncbi:kinase-like domain-containing protein [Flagelloscypha sp. PMI_526]|nr:kinase-like domain-containing protein [Flagelloscypha sp. PMI_526]
MVPESGGSHPDLDTGRRDSISYEGIELLHLWFTEQKDNLSQGFLGAFDIVLPTLEKGQISLGKLDDPLCLMCLECCQDTSFLRLLNSYIPRGFQVYFTDRKDEDLGTVVDSLAIVTPTRQFLWDVRGPAPSPVLFLGAEQTLWKLLDTTSDREIVGNLEILNKSLALCVMEVFQWGIDFSASPRHKTRCLRILRKLAKKHRAVPSSLRLRELTVNRNGQQVGGGGFSDVWPGYFGDLPVCVKVLRFFTRDSQTQRVIKAFCHETLIWRQLRHSNVLPFLGFNDELLAPGFCLVSPFLANGSITNFLSTNRKHDMMKIFVDVVRGMQYLHTFNPPIVHGDIRGANILVKDNFDCCLSDFGLSIITESRVPDPTSFETSGGSAQWMAPELLDTTLSFPSLDKRTRDIYAFACTVVELITRRRPWPSHPTDGAVCFDVVVKGLRPARPSNIFVPDDFWALVERSWSQNPLERPTSAEIFETLLEFPPLFFDPELDNPDEDEDETVTSWTEDVEEEDMESHLNTPHHSIPPELYPESVDSDDETEGEVSSDVPSLSPPTDPPPHSQKHDSRVPETTAAESPVIPQIGSPLVPSNESSYERWIPPKSALDEQRETSQPGGASLGTKPYPGWNRSTMLWRRERHRVEAEEARRRAEALRAELDQEVSEVESEGSTSSITSTRIDEGSLNSDIPGYTGVAFQSSNPNEDDRSSFSWHDPPTSWTPPTPLSPQPLHGDEHRNLPEQPEIFQANVPPPLNEFSNMQSSWIPTAPKQREPSTNMGVPSKPTRKTLSGLLSPFRVVKVLLARLFGRS